MRFARGDVLLDPTDRGYTADMRDCAFALLRVPRAVAGDLAEEHTGLPAADLQFESVSRVGPGRRVVVADGGVHLRQLACSGD